MKNVIFLFFLASFCGYSQVQKKTVTAKYINEKIELDAVLNEKSWSEAQKAKDFYEYFPSDTIQAKAQTEIQFLFDDKFLYVGIKVFAKGKDFIVPSLRRDFRAGVATTLR